MKTACAEDLPIPEFEDHRIVTIEGLQRAEETTVGS